MGIEFFSLLWTCIANCIPKLFTLTLKISFFQQDIESAPVELFWSGKHKVKFQKGSTCFLGIHSEKVIGELIGSLKFASK
jgi:hypothetical protein